MSAKRVALLLDGGFVKKRLGMRIRAAPSVQDIVGHTASILQHPRLNGMELFRIYYYDAPPFDGKVINPLDRSVIDFSKTPQYKAHLTLLEELELQPDFAVRRGTLIAGDWGVKLPKLRELRKSPRPLAASDLLPGLKQKGVDMRVGLDLASLAVKRIVQEIVLVTGDSDFVPAMKFARTEGLRVYLDTMGQMVRRELRAHADILL